MNSEIEWMNQVAKQVRFSEMIGVSKAAVSKMVSDGKLKPNGTYLEWLHAYCDNLRTNAAGWLEGDGDAPDPLKLARIRETNMKANKLEIEVCEKAGELVPIESVIELQIERELAAKTELNTLPPKIMAYYEFEHNLSPSDKDKRFLNDSIRAITRHMEGASAEQCGEDSD